MRAKNPDDDRVANTFYVVGNLSVYKDGVPLEPKAAAMNLAQARFIKPRDFVVDASLDYVLRHVVNGANTSTESDDEVQFERRSIAVNGAVVIHAAEMTTPLWGLTTANRKVVMVESSVGLRQILFTPYEDAETFAQWLKVQKAGKIGPQALKVADESDLHHATPLAGGKRFPTFFPSRKDPELRSR